jgi:quercetin dioxygenase-like cupin family protein
VSIVQPTPREPMVGDPDDHRPRSEWRLVVDPGDESGRVEGLALIEEQIAPGDAIPLHRHDVDELIVVVAGEGVARLGDAEQRVGPGAAIFIPAGAAHGTRNVSGGPMLVHAVFPATTIDIDMLERNPAPGTEDEPPRRSRYDLRTGAFEIVS